MLEIKRQSSPLSSDTVSSVSSVLDKLVSKDVPPHVEIFIEAIALLKEAGASNEEVGEFEKKIKERVPLAAMFAPENERKKRREEVMTVSEETKA